METTYRIVVSDLDGNVVFSEEITVDSGGNRMDDAREVILDAAVQVKVGLI